MKSINALLTLGPILILSVMISACGGGGQTSASLEIVNGFAVSALGYDGGLIIYGEKKDSSETFSRPITTSTSVTLELPNGTWIIRAIGWNGDNLDLARKFGSTPFCGVTEANLTGGSASVNLKLSTATCLNDDFASAAHRDGVAFAQFGDFVTTRSLMATSTPSDIPNTKFFTGSHATSSIINNLAPDMRSPVRSVRVFALRKDIGSGFTKGFGSKCLPTTSLTGVADKSSKYSALDFRLPTKGVPLEVELYENDNCTESITSYVFPKGFEGPTEGDFQFHMDTNTSKNRLILIATDMKKGYSPLYGHLPYVKCYNGSSAYHCPTTPAVTKPDFVIHKSSNQTVRIEDGSDCAGPTITSGITITGTCVETDEGFEVNLDASSAVTTNNYTLANGLKSYLVNVIDNVAADRIKLDAYRDMINGLGASDYTNYKKTFLNDKDDDGDRIAYGRLGRVREHLSPAGAMGLFGLWNPAQSFTLNCQNILGTREVSSTKDGETDRYRVVVSNIALTPSSTHYCNISDTTATDCTGFQYDKKIQVFELNYSDSLPVMTYAIDCDTLQGKYEVGEVEFENNGNKRKEHREIITWNVTPLADLSAQRYEFLEAYSDHDLVSGVWVPREVRRSMGRVAKTAQEKAQLQVFDFSSRYESGTFRQHLDARHMMVVPTLFLTCVKNLSLPEPAGATFDQLFTAGGAVASARVGMGAFDGNTPDQLDHLSMFAGAAVINATSNCSSSNPLSPMPAGANGLINESVTPHVDSLATITSQFGTFLGF